MADDDVMRFAPPEIRRLWRKMVAMEEQVQSLQRQQERALELLTRLTAERGLGPQT